MSSQVTMKQLLEAGVHFGHQSRRWNPKMKPYIYTARNNIYIIDLKKTLRLLRDATKYVRDEVQNGAKVLFVGTKKQAKPIVEEAALHCGMYYVNNRWLGGLLTNWRTIRKSIDRLLELEQMFADGTINNYVKKERSAMSRELASLKKNLDGIKHMQSPPDIMFVIDPGKEHIAVSEANKLRIPVVGVVDTNCDPDPVDVVIPGNDDAIRSIRLMCMAVADSCNEGMAAATEGQFGGEYAEGEYEVGEYSDPNVQYSEEQYVEAQAPAARQQAPAAPAEPYSVDPSQYRAPASFSQSRSAAPQQSGAPSHAPQHQGSDHQPQVLSAEELESQYKVYEQSDDTPGQG